MKTREPSRGAKSVRIRTCSNTEALEDRRAPIITSNHPGHRGGNRSTIKSALNAGMRLSRHRVAARSKDESSTMLLLSKVALVAVWVSGAAAIYLEV